VNGETRTAASAPGVPASALAQVIGLDYGNPQSLEILRARGSEIAAVRGAGAERRLDLQLGNSCRAAQGNEETGTARFLTKSSLASACILADRKRTSTCAPIWPLTARSLAAASRLVQSAAIQVHGRARRWAMELWGQLVPGSGVTSSPARLFATHWHWRRPGRVAAPQRAGPELQKNLNGEDGAACEEMRAIIDEFEAPYQLTHSCP